MDLTLEPPPVRQLEAGATLTVRPGRGNASIHRLEGLAPETTFEHGGHHTVVPTLERMRVERLSIHYGQKQAVSSVSLPVRQGEVLGLIGPSGCGKTTLLRSLNRLTELTKSASISGRITLDGVDITGLEPTALRRRVTMVFQQPNPFPMSIFDNVAYVLREQARRKPRKPTLAPLVEEALSRAGLLEEVKDNLNHPALRLSGGQQQRLCIARALAANPEVLLLDEPCSALDPQSTKVIEDLIVKLREEVAVVIVTHNLQQAHRVADHVAFMYLGELVEYAPTRALFAAPREQRTKEYVGGAFG
ncbi:MAG TPA: ATP-binding cassette domain-containing protein [Solirubrobacteraceae bacterium]|jgi:phosphate transport system ATP-binding protein|nr:ATP-binding cassette domain-containing protein [Solirubrobacteraceae bacterium]